jgi:NAD(P)-dependent dehydrogenase (short-subunit alcohol dehydrogenase family)
VGRLAGKVAIVTGAASARGFGFATARIFAREGAKVVLTDISADAVKARAADLQKTGAGAVGLGHDVTSEDAWKQIVAQTVREFGRVDVLVNNAGIADLGGIETTTLKAWDRMIAINLTGVFLGCQNVIRQFRVQKSGGSIINIASSAALNAHPDNCAYCASKGGVMYTDMTANALKSDPALVQAIINNVPMKALGAADDIAAMNLFLASDESKYVTGTRFSVDGGLTAK